MSHVVILQAWPGFMKVETAAAYFDMRRSDFLKAVSKGAIPQPVLVGDKERWRLSDLQVVDETGLNQQSEVWEKGAVSKREKPWLKNR